MIRGFKLLLIILKDDNKTLLFLNHSKTITNPTTCVTLSFVISVRSKIMINTKKFGAQISMNLKELVADLMTLLWLKTPK